MAPTATTLKQLLQKWRKAVAGTGYPQPPVYTGPDIRLERLVEHTGEVEPGSAFVARVRATSDGHPYIGKAVTRGASLIVGERPVGALGIKIPDGVPYLQVDDTAVAMAWLAAAWHDFPARELVMIGITGTDGKTTTSNILHQVLQAAGIRAGLLSTIRAVIGTAEEPLALHVTTPEAPVVQHYLRRMVDAGLTHCVLEATSHGLAQHRVGAIDFDMAVVTNITHEHLDYHGSYEAYRAAKARLVENLNRRWGAPARSGQTPEKTAVLNLDDDSYQWLAPIPSGRVLTYGLGPDADVSAKDVTYAAASTTFSLNLPGQIVSVEATLVGDFNLYNMLAAAAAAHALGIRAELIKAGLEAVEALSGRMERIDTGQPFLTLVDFAHTPNALERAIAAAQRMVQANGRIITVFGSAGKRDVAKRRLMAEISARDADLTVLTAEDPRTESLAEILETMAEGCRAQGGIEGDTFWRIPDRGRAIYHALSLARPQDLVLICGKGHEQSICFGTTEYPWDDREATLTALRALAEGKAMPDLGLPTF